MLKSKHNSKGKRERLHPCFRCAKIGHSPALYKKLGAVKHVQEEQVESDREYSLFSIPSHGTSKPYTVTLEEAGQQLQMEIDTGASFSNF